MKGNFKTFKEANDYLGKKDQRTLGGNRFSTPTVVRRLEDGNIAVRLCNTDVITYNKDGKRTVLNSGGWRTVTTKDRICEYSRFSLHAERGIWYLSGPYMEDKGRQELGIFEDNCVITEIKEGVFKAIGVTKITPKAEKANSKKIKAIANYCKAYIEKLFSGNMEKPGAGDCFYCQMEFKNDKGETISPKSDHIALHIKEKYYVPSLLMQAEKQYPMAPIAKNEVGCLWEKKPENSLGESMQKLAKEQAYKTLYRFVKLHMNLWSSK